MFEYDVFICYSSKDKPIIETLIEDLKREQITYWIDAEQIKFGDIIIDKINDGLKKSKFIIPCLSKNLITSGWTSSEYGAVLNAELSGNSKRTVIPLKLDDCEDDDIPPLLRVKKRVVYSDKIELKELIKFLKKHQSLQKEVEDILKQEIESMERFERQEDELKEKKEKEEVEQKQKEQEEQEKLIRQREDELKETEIRKKIEEIENIIWISPVIKKKNT